MPSSPDQTNKISLVDFFRQPGSIRLIVWASAALLAFFYFFYPAFPTNQGKNLVTWTWLACNGDSNFLHGRFIPVAFVVMAWMAFKRTKNEVLHPSYLGLIGIAIALLTYLVAVRTIQPRIALIGSPAMVIGIAYYLGGPRVARHFVFAGFFLWFAIPVPGLEAALTGNLQTMITKACYHTGVFFGMDLTSQGATITIAGSSLEVAEGCSGIRSLMALVMIAAVYANYTQKSLWKKAVLFGSSLPLAIIGNFGRIFTILVLTQMGFGEFAKKTYHDWAGLLFFFPIALSGLYLVDYCLNSKTRRKQKVRRAVRTSKKTSFKNKSS